MAAALVADPARPPGPGAGPPLPTRDAVAVGDDVAADVAAGAAMVAHLTEAKPADQPDAVQPQASAKRTPPKVQPGKPTRTPQRDDLICGDCGEVNAPGRRFCSRCGSSLVSAVVVKIPWHKRIFKRKPKSAMAGERPWTEKSGANKKPRAQGVGKIVRPVRRVASIVLLLLGILYGVYAPFRHWVNERWDSAKDKVVSIIHPQFDPVTAGPGTTSNEQTPLDADHPATMATDGFKNTYWLVPPPSADFRPELDVQLTEKADLARIIVRSGASDDFQGHHRPKTLLFIYDNGTSQEVHLKDTPDPQTITIDGKGVQRFKIAVPEIYESIDGTDMGLTEVEFFEKH